MPIPTNQLTLTWRQPDNDTPIEGTWRVWLETEHGVALNDVGEGIAGAHVVSTVSGVATIDLPDTTHEDFTPQNAHYRASFTSADRRVREKSEPFVMDADKTTADIFTPTNLPVSPSAAARAEEAALQAADALSDVEEIRDSFSALTHVGIDADGTPYFDVGLTWDTSVPVFADTDGTPYVGA